MTPIGRFFVALKFWTTLIARIVHFHWSSLWTNLAHAVKVWSIWHRSMRFGTHQWRQPLLKWDWGPFPARPSTGTYLGGCLLVCLLAVKIKVEKKRCKFQPTLCWKETKKISHFFSSCVARSFAFLTGFWCEIHVALVMSQPLKIETQFSASPVYPGQSLLCRSLPDFFYIFFLLSKHNLWRGKRRTFSSFRTSRRHCCN